MTELSVPVDEPGTPAVPAHDGVAASEAATTRTPEAVPAEQTSVADEMVTVTYSGPSGSLLADGYRADRGATARWPRSVVQRINATLPEHSLRITEEPVATVAQRGDNRTPRGGQSQSDATSDAEQPQGVDATDGTGTVASGADRAHLVESDPPASP